MHELLIKLGTTVYIGIMAFALSRALAYGYVALSQLLTYCIGLNKESKATLKFESANIWAVWSAIFFFLVMLMYRTF